MAIMTMDDCDKKIRIGKHGMTSSNNFINNFEKGNKVKSLIADDFHRQQIKYIKTWIIENIK
jgi:hypothetical protein